MNYEVVLCFLRLLRNVMSKLDIVGTCIGMITFIIGCQQMKLGVPWSIF